MTNRKTAVSAFAIPATIRDAPGQLHHGSNPARGRSIGVGRNLLVAPRPPSQATARPNREDVHISECGRDEAFRIVGFSPYQPVGVARQRQSIICHTSEACPFRQQYFAPIFRRNVR